MDCSKAHLPAFEQSIYQPTDFGKVEFGSGRSRSAKCDPQKLQTRERLARTLGHDPKRVGAHRGVGFVLEHLETIDDGTHRPHEVVANPAHKKARKVEVVHGRRQLVSSW